MQPISSQLFIYKMKDDQIRFGSFHLSSIESLAINRKSSTTRNPIQRLTLIDTANVSLFRCYLQGYIQMRCMLHVRFWMISRDLSQFVNQIESEPKLKPKPTLCPCHAKLLNFTQKTTKKQITDLNSHDCSFNKNIEIYR